MVSTDYCFISTELFCKDEEFPGGSGNGCHSALKASRFQLITPASWLIDKIRQHSICKYHGSTLLWHLITPSPLC